MGLMAALLVGMVVVTQAANLRQAVKAYLFGFPLVIMDLTREHHLARTGKPNALSLARQFPTPQFKEVVRPNLDTLYATAFLDTRLGPPRATAVVGRLELARQRTAGGAFAACAQSHGVGDWAHPNIGH